MVVRKDDLIAMKQRAAAGPARGVRRVTVLDAERWIHTADLQDLVPDSVPNKVHRGRRGWHDPVYSITRLSELTRPTFRLARLWEPLLQVLLLPRFVIHWLGRYIRARHGGSVPGAEAPR
jgi:hypothetical protein